MMSDHDKIAHVVEAFLDNRWQMASNDPYVVTAALQLESLTASGPVVDLTAISAELEQTSDVALYEDHPCIAMPWKDAMFAWVGSSGRVRLIPVSAAEAEGAARWDTPNIDDWNQVKWVLTAGYWLEVGVRYDSNPDIVSGHTLYGPVYGWLIAVGHQGEPLDIHWTDLTTDSLRIDVKPEDQEQFFTTGLTHVLKALNFLNCSNVDIVEPQRSRAQRRRLERAGVHIHELTVYPRGSQSRFGNDPSGVGVPLHSVRGHFAEYGPKYDKGLLFGKYEGRYWIPQHARGSSEYGVDVHSYKLVE